MIGSLDPRKKEVTVIGAGVAGLLAAYYLDKKGYEVTLLEKTSRAGGLIATKTTPFGMTELAVHSFLATPAVRRLCEDLAVPLVPVKKCSRARFIYREGRLRKFPLNWNETIEALLRAFFVRGFSERSLSLEVWGNRHLGIAATKYILGPFVRGIYGALPSEIGMDAAFPSLRVSHRHSLLSQLLVNATRKREQKPMMAPARGMGAIISALEERLEVRLGSRFQKNVEVKELPQTSNLLLCVPANSAGDLIEVEVLKKIPYTPLISVTAFIEKNGFSQDRLSGIGVLVPPCESRKCLGILFNSSSFEGRVMDEDKYASFTFMLGGTSHPELIQASDKEISKIVCSELREFFKIQSEPIHLEIHRWPRAIPQYSQELILAWELVKKGWCSQPGRMLFGNYTGQVSIRGMIECGEKL